MAAIEQNHCVTAALRDRSQRQHLLVMLLAIDDADSVAACRQSCPVLPESPAHVFPVPRQKLQRTWPWPWHSKQVMVPLPWQRTQPWSPSSPDPPQAVQTTVFTQRIQPLPLQYWQLFIASGER